MQEVGGRLAVVLGASGGLGSAAASALVAAGWDVVRHHHRNRPAPSALVLGDLPADLRDLDSAKALAASVVGIAGRAPDAVVNCVGHRRDGLLISQSPDQWHEVVAANLDPAYNAVRAFLPLMMRRRGGSFVHVVSIAGPAASPGQTAYAAAKAAVIGMTRSLAAEYGRRQIVFNAIAPGFVDTGMTADVPTEVIEAIRSRQALPGPLEAAAVADAVVFLAGTRSMTGQVLTVDRGLTI
jgi:3-oxoacyl-[acyl-carrier protein] reductase